MTFPKESVERIELLAAPERERDGTEREVPIETVPVAVRLARERLPEMRPLPWTERIWVGELVPMPIDPKYPAPDAVKDVVEAKAVVIVPVAVRLARERFPENRADPWRARAWEGVVVDMPILRFWVPPAPSDSLYTVRRGLPSIWALYDSMVPWEAVPVTGISAHDTWPELVSKTMFPSSRLSILVTPEVKSYLREPLFTSMPPAKVEVAVVEVAVKAGAIGAVNTTRVVLVALVVVAFVKTEFTPTTFPRVAVPVAVRLARERSPEKRAEPWRESACVGEVVPRPRFPAASIRARSDGLEPVLKMSGDDAPPAPRIVEPDPRLR